MLMVNSSKAIPRLGIPQFSWWNEALHGVGRNGYATTFPSCIGMASSFDDALLYKVYTVVSDEARAKNTAQRKKGRVERYQGVSFWTPTINIFRDPRWGRGQESYGEDPYQMGRMASQVVRGLQGETGHKYRKLYACAKHFAVHSGPESTRHKLNLDNISPRDLWETYLPAFKTLVMDAGVKEVMCAYQRLDGEPCCGSNRLLNQILRNEWGFDGLVVSDCGALRDFYHPNAHHVSKDAPSAAGKAVLAGTDVNCGGVYDKNIPEAVRQGHIKESDVDVCVKRLLEGRFELGDFDPDELNDWTKIPLSVICCQEHRQLARKMAQEQMVLLQNKHNALPLQKNEKVMLMGPNAADSVMLWGIYYGTPMHSVTIKEGIENKIGKVPYYQGCSIVDLVETVSRIGEFRTPDGKVGLAACYWNNANMEGEPVATATYSSPLDFDNGGNTVFAPGVNLEDFSARFTSIFTPQEDQELVLSVSGDDGYQLIVNNDTLMNFWKKQDLRTTEKKYKVKKGLTYTIILNYFQLKDGATLRFDAKNSFAISMDKVLEKTKNYETIIFAGGISPIYEREETKVEIAGFKGGDRTSIELPQVQRDILKALGKTGKKIIFVNCSGSAVALTPETESCDAILQAWYPGEEGGNAVADVLYGDYNPGGKLPLTFYKDDSVLKDFEDYSMKGYTYRYLTQEPLFPYGFGLSYTTFELKNAKLKMNRNNTGTLTLEVANTGKMDGTEIVQLYMRCLDDKEGPLKTLRGYERVEVAAGQTKKVEIAIPASTFERFDPSTNTMRIVPGKYELLYGTSSASKDLTSIKYKVK